MEYEGQICRPPMERSSFMLGVAVGCAYNRCTFCTLFKHLVYRELPLAQIEDELKRVHDLGGSPRSIFLGDGNAFGMAMPRLMSILSLIRKYFPACEMVNMDATVTDIRKKTTTNCVSSTTQAYGGCIWASRADWTMCWSLSGKTIPSNRLRSRSNGCTMQDSVSTPTS